MGFLFRSITSVFQASFSPGLHTSFGLTCPTRVNFEHLFLPIRGMKTVKSVPVLMVLYAPLLFALRPEGPSLEADLPDVASRLRTGCVRTGKPLPNLSNLSKLEPYRYVSTLVIPCFLPLYPLRSWSAQTSYIPKEAC